MRVSSTVCAPVRSWPPCWSRSRSAGRWPARPDDSRCRFQDHLPRGHLIATPQAGLPALRGILAVLDDGQRSALVDLGRWVTYEDEPFVRQGGQDRAMYVLADGLATVTVSTAQGNELLLELLGPGDTVGELSLLDAAPRSATVAARGRVRALRLELAAFEEFLRAHPEAMLQLLRIVARRLRLSDQARLDLATLQTSHRVARRLLELAADHGQLIRGGAVEIGLALTQSELAAWVGASREGVSEALGALRADGIVETGRRSLIILDLPRLRDRASP